MPESRIPSPESRNAKRLLICGVSTRAAADSAARAGFVVTAIDAYGDLDHHPSVRALSLPRDVGRPFTALAAARAARTFECDAVAYLSSFENQPRAVDLLASGRTLWGNPPAVLRRVRDPLLLMRTLRARGLASPVVRLHHTRDAGLGIRDSRSGTRDPGFGIRDSKSATRDSGFGTRDSGFSFTREQENGGCHVLEDEPSGVISGEVADPGLGTRGSNMAPIREAGRYTATVWSDVREWLLKPLKSGGGHGVRRWRRGGRIARGSYLQERIDGTSGSVVFVAAGGRAVPLGISRILAGERAFGAAEYRYCGNILAAAGDAQFARDQTLVEGACALAEAIAAEFGLAGVNGIDFVAREGIPYAIEVNPRWSASMELVERAYGLSVFGAHAAACASGVLPAFDLARARRGGGASGKAIVFARRDVVISDTRGWLLDDSIRDVPRPGERIRAGQPVCTVFADGPDAARCHAALVIRAERVYAQMAVTEDTSTSIVG